MWEDLNGFEWQVADQSEDGLSNSLNLTNQEFYIHLVDEKTKKTIAPLQAVPSPSCVHYDFPPSLTTACHTG